MSDLEKFIRSHGFHTVALPNGKIEIHIPEVHVETGKEGMHIETVSGILSALTALGY